METDKIKNLERRVKLENQKNVLIYPVIFSICLLGFTAIVIYYLPIYCEKNELFRMTVLSTGLGILISLFSLLRGIKKNKEVFAKTASFIDRDADSKNRLEASLELIGTENLLKEEQIKQTNDFFSHYKQSKWPVFRILFIILIGLLISNISFSLRDNYIISEIAKIEKNIEGNNKEKEIKNEEKREPDFAELAITEPESEMRSKPMDEIAWSGIANSSQGFKNLSIDISINGKFKENIPVYKFDNKKGEISFEDEFYLDEINVVPFDVVTYNLKAISNIDGQDKEIISVPQFIEVRPFREDAQLLSKKDMEKMETKEQKKILSVLSLIRKILVCQISLNKATYTARASGLDINDNIYKEQVAIIAKEQQFLHEEVDRLLKEISADKISANMMDCLQKASESMKMSAEYLNNKKSEIIKDGKNENN